MKRRSDSFLVRMVALTMLTVQSVSPCTTFVVQRDGHIVFGRNLDWHCGNGLVIVNPRHLEKTALGTPSQHPAAWTARYGSVTFNQIGRELPFGGMNEAGLVVEHMTLEHTVYPAADSRCTIGAFQCCIAAKRTDSAQTSPDTSLVEHAFRSLSTGISLPKRLHSTEDGD